MAVNASAALATQVRQTSMILFHQFTEKSGAGGGWRSHYLWFTKPLLYQRELHRQKTRHMVFCVQMQLKIAVCVENGSDSWTRTSDGLVASRLTVCSLLPTRVYPNKSKTRLKWQFFFNVLNNQEDGSIITIFNLVCCCRVFQMVAGTEYCHPCWEAYETPAGSLQSIPQSTHSCFQHLQSACLKARCRAWPKDLVQHSSAPNDAKPPIINYRFSKNFLNELSHSINKTYYTISKKNANKNLQTYRILIQMAAVGGNAPPPWTSKDQALLLCKTAISS